MSEVGTEELIDANTLFGSIWTPERRDVSLERLMATMDRFGISKAITLSAKGIFADSVLGNDETLSVCLKEPRLIPALAINPNEDLNYTDEIVKRIKEGFKILRLFPEYQGYAIKSIQARKVIAKAAKEGVPIMVSKTAGITNILELTKELDDLVVVITDVSWANIAEVLAAMSESQNLYIETHLLNGLHDISRIVKEFGADRLIFGSGSPLGYVGSSLNLIRHASISEAEKKMILFKNIEKLIGGC